MSRPSRCLRTMAGHTLLELVLSLVLLGIVFASVGSAVMFASSASPADDSFEVTMATDSRVISQIAEDLSVAKYFLEQEQDAVTIVVADRTGDGIPDRIRYAWLGHDEDPLTYQLNDNPAVNLIDQASKFNIDYNLEVLKTTLPGTTGWGDPKNSIENKSATQSRDYMISEREWIGQLFKTVPLDSETQVRIEKVRISARARGGMLGETSIEIQSADESGLPTGTVLASASMMESDLILGGYTWHEAVFSEPAVINVGEYVCLVLRWVSDTNPAMVEYDRRAESASAGFVKLITSNGGVTWTQQAGESLLFEVDVAPLETTDGYDVKTTHWTSSKITLQSAVEDRSPLSRTVRILLSPPSLEAFAEADFDANPTVMDLNADGIADWSHSAGTFPEGSNADGIWTANGQLIFAYEELSSAKVITVDARMRSNDTLGPTIYGPYTIGGGKLLPLIAQLRADGAGGQELVLYNDTTMKTAAAVVTGLPSGLVDIRLILLPDKETVVIQINHQTVGSVLLTRIDDPGSVAEDVRFGSSGGVAEIDSVRVRVGGDYSGNSDTDGMELSDVFDLIIH